MRQRKLLIPPAGVRPLVCPRLYGGRERERTFREACRRSRVEVARSGGGDGCGGRSGKQTACVGCVHALRRPLRRESPAGSRAGASFAGGGETGSWDGEGKGPTWDKQNEREQEPSSGRPTDPWNN